MTEDRTQDETTSDETYVADRMAEHLRAWEADIRKLRARAEEAGADTREDVQREFEELESRRDEAKAAWRKAAETSGEASREMWKGFEDAGRALSKAWDRAVSRL